MKSRLSGQRIGAKDAVVDIVVRSPSAPMLHARASIYARSLVEVFDVHSLAVPLQRVAGSITVANMEVDRNARSTAAKSKTKEAASANSIPAVLDARAKRAQYTPHLRRQDTVPPTSASAGAALPPWSPTRLE